MTTARILIVEDEILVARDLEQQLTALGYTIVGLAASGPCALELIAREHPNLVLMDIRLQGPLDGIAVAQAIHDRYFLPVVYLTAHADCATLQRARVTEPFGYVLKPFEEQELRTVIEMALYKHAAERKLRASEERYATTLRSIGDAVIATDAQGCITYMNPVAEALTGWPLVEAAGQSLGVVFRIISEETRQPLENLVERALCAANTSGLTQNSILLVSRHGREIPIEDRAAPILNNYDTCIGIVLSFRDISERRQAEQRLHTVEMHLRQAQKMEAVGQLAAGIAHDFNNQLTVIQGYGSILLKLLNGEDNSMKYAERILTAAKRAEELTQQLLAFSRRQMLQPRILDLNQIVTDMEQMLSRLLGEHIAIATELDPALASVAADPSQLEQVVMNLAFNARDAMPDGGVITLRTANVRFDAAAAQLIPEMQPGAYVCLTVEDTGAGMSEEIAAHVFEPFFTTKALGKGTGLGLATVYGIVKQSGGQILLHSEERRGSKFIIYLPAVDRAPLSDTLTAQLPDLPHGVETILLVEDEEALRDFVSEVLTLCGYTVLKTQNGVEALQIMRRYEERVHLLLTDIVMPKMNGWELTAQLAKYQEETKILYMSGYAENFHLHAHAQKGNVNLLPKPFTPELLARKVRALLDE
ncbi:MAG: response regulator [Caldilineaceae bacterium]